MRFLLLSPAPRFPILFFKNLSLGLVPKAAYNLNRPEEQLRGGWNSGTPPLYFSGGDCVGLGPLLGRATFANPPLSAGATGIGKRLPNGRRGEDVREGDQPPPRMDDGPAPCFPVSEFE